MSPPVSRRDTHSLTPPQARRPASSTEAAIHPLGLASWKGHARGGTVGDRDVDDKPPWMGSRRVPTWAWPFRGAPHASQGSEHRAQGALLRRAISLRRLRRRRGPRTEIGSASCRVKVCQYV